MWYLNFIENYEKRELPNQNNFFINSEEHGVNYDWEMPKKASSLRYKKIQSI